MKLFCFILVILLSQCKSKETKKRDERNKMRTEYARKDSSISDHKSSFRIVYKDTSGNMYTMSQAVDMIGNLDYFTIMVKPGEVVLYPMPEEVKRKYLNIEPAPSDFFTTGSKFSSFLTKDLNGKTIDLKNLAGKILVLNYWFIGCLPCRKEIPKLNKIVDEYRSDSGVVFIAKIGRAHV